MADIRVTMFRRTFFIGSDIFTNKENNSRTAWIAGPGFEEVVNNFYRNHLTIRYVTANFKSGARSYNDEQEDVGEFLEEVKRVCDENATGFWTWDQWYHRNYHIDTNTQKPVYLDTGDGRINIFFENTADLEAVLKNCHVVKDLI